MSMSIALFVDPEGGYSFHMSILVEKKRRRKHICHMSSLLRNGYVSC